jgi:tetratricopeptide (TPR) repeat protein
MMPQTRRRRLFAAFCLTLGLGPLMLPAAQPALAAADRAEVAQRAAEQALREGKCREAAELLVAEAAASADVAASVRATQLALGCEQVPLALQAARRWQALAPFSGEAALARAIAALKLYQLEEGRAALVVWRDSAAGGNQDPRRFVDLLEQEVDSTALYRSFGPALVDENSNAEVVLALAGLAQRSDDLKAAVAHAQRALALQDNLLEAQVLLLRSQAGLGEHEAALAAARELQPRLQGADSFLVADLLLAAGREEAAREELLRLRADERLAEEADRRLGALALAQGDEAEAERRFTALLAQRGSTAIALLHLAQIAERRGDWARAQRAYPLLADGPYSRSALAGLARVLLRQGKRDQALALFDEQERKQPGSAVELIATRAAVLAATGDPAAAVVALDAGLLRHPGHPSLEYERATALERAGQHREAERAFEQMLRKRPDDPGIANALGFTLADHGRQLPRAERLVRQALAVSPDNPAIQDSLGWVLFRRGRLDEAGPWLEQAWQRSRDAEIGAHFGEYLWRKGEQGRAHFVWQQARNAAPDNPLLAETVQRLTEEPAAAR